MAEPVRDLTQPGTDFTLDTAAELAAEEHGVPIVGRSPWYLAWRRLRRNYVALGALGLFFVVVIACSLAPVYAHDVAHTSSTEVVTDVKVHGKYQQVISSGETKFNPVTGQIETTGTTRILGPQWTAAGGKMVLGADSLGRDAAVRLPSRGPPSPKI